MATSDDVMAVREALQARILVELMGNSMSRELTLKGGLAMRAVHGSVRYTKDIDLDADRSFAKQRIEGIVERSIKTAVSSGLIEQPKVTHPKASDTTLRWKINGVQPGGTSPLHLTVEISMRDPVTLGHAIEVPLHASFAAAPGTKVRVLDSKALAVTKVFALTSVNRTAPRDLYDLAILIEAEIPSPSDILAKVPDARTRLPQALNDLWQKIEALSYQQFESEVLPYLPASVAETIDEEVFDAMRIRVGEHVEQWLRDAIATPTMPTDTAIDMEMAERPAAP